MATATAKYTASDIVALEGLEPVRKRPGMYIGGVNQAGLHHLVWEILDNSVDEAMNGYASEIQVTLHKDGQTVTVSDNGRGIPVDKHPRTGKPALEMVLTMLHAGGKFEGKNYKTSGGLHGVGASVVNALSRRLEAVVRRDGAQYRMEFARGVAVSKLQKAKQAVRGTGTTITFTPDPTIFPKTEFDSETIRHRIEVVSYIHRGLKITFHDETSGKKETFQHERGLVDYLAKILTQRNARPIHESPWTLSRDEDARIEIALQWTESTDEHVRSYVNGIPTGMGGTHENGFRSGLIKGVRNYIETHELVPRGVKITHEDIREGLIAVVSVFIPDPQFQGQTKDRLNNSELQNTVEAAVRPALEQWLNTNRSTADTIVARVIAAARARAASRAASESVSRKTGSSRAMLPGKLSDCLHSSKQPTELFIVEGDSAGGTAKQGRDRNFQAILPLRGKVLNTEAVGLKKLLENREIQDIITALGCGIGKDLDPGRLRYDRVILLADADSDGHHITTLLLTLFYRHMQPLIADGRVFIAQPPLYRIDIGKETCWAADDADRDRILASRKGRGEPEITRFKGLGEMPSKVLWDTTLNPATRRLLKVAIDDHLETDRIMSELMGKDPSARFRFIMERAEEAEEIDV